MDGAGAVLDDGLAVGFGPVSLVPRKAVDGIFSVHLLHIGIPRDFGKDAGGGNGDAFGVALDHRDLQYVQAGDRHRIVDQHIRTDAELSDGGAHGFVGGLQNIDLVNPFGRTHHHSPGQCLLFDLLKQNLAALLGDFFGVIQIGQEEIVGQDDRRRCHRARKRSPSRLVDPAYVTVSARAADRFQFKIAHLPDSLELCSHAGFSFFLRSLFLCHTSSPGQFFMII